MLTKRFVIWMASASMDAMLLLSASGAATALTPATADSAPARVRINGLSLDVRSTLIPMAAEPLAEAIIAAWRDAGIIGLRFDPGAGRTVLGRQSGPVHETVTLLRTSNPNKTAVVHATQDVRQGTTALPSPPFALPRGLQVIETIEQMDRGQPSNTFRIDSSLPKLEALERLRLALVASGWSVTARIISNERSCMLAAERGRQKLMILSVDDQSRVRFVVEVTGRAS